MFAMRTAARLRPIQTIKFGVLTSALLASTALVSVTTPASAAFCNAANDAQYDACVTAFLAGDTVNVNGAATHNLNYVTGGFLSVNSGGALTDVGGLFGTGLQLTVASGGALTLNGTDASGTGGFDTFASFGGGGTVTFSVAGTNGMVFGANNASTAFSGTIVAPSLNNFVNKVGTGTFTVNGMTMAEGELLVSGGGLAANAGTTNIKSLALGTGTGGTGVGSVAGGTLNITGIFAGGPPCAANCPALRIGDFFGTGVMNQSNGTVNVGTAGVAASMNIGNQSGNGTYNMSGGTLNLGVFGDANTAGLYAIGRQASGSAAHIGQTTTGVLNISFGTVNVNAGELINGDRDAGGAAGVITNSTINLSGGLLRVRNGANLWLSAFDNGAAIDSTFNLSGTGILEIGDGRLQSAYGGGTGAYRFNLNGGTIRVIDSALVTSVDAVLQGGSAAAGTQLDTNGIGATLNGVLSGTGWIVKTGLGTLNLNGVNTYTGGTGMHGGVVFVDAASDLGANSAAMSFDNAGILRLGAAGVLATRTGGANVLGSGGTIDLNGFSTVYDGNITGPGTLTVLGGATLDIAGANDSHSGGLNITGAGTSVIASFGVDDNIGNTSAVFVGTGASLQVDSETIGSLAGSGLMTIRNGETMTTGGNNISTVWSGTFAATTAGMTKVGTGTMTVNNNIAYTGLTTVNGGSLLLNGTMADSLLIGVNGRFGGNATVTGNVTNNGHIAPGNSPGTVTILGNYTAGVGAIFDMEVQFANAGAPVNGTTHDFVSIAGNVTGTTRINVIAFPPSVPAAATTGNGVELVRVAGAVAGNQFQLAAPVVQGAYEYLLTYRPNFSGVNDGWFLTSRASENMYGELAMFTGGSALIDNCFRGEESLVGDGNGREGRGWARVKTGGHDTGADTGLDTEQEYNCGSAGFDVKVADNMRLGASTGYATSDMNIVTPTGIADMGGDTMMAQAYLAMHHGNFFANLSAGYASMELHYVGPVSGPLTGELNGVIGGLQVGTSWAMGDFWGMRAIGELNYDGLDCDDNCLLPGTVADTADWSAKGTLRIDGRLHDGMFLPYLAVSISDRFGDVTVTNGAATLTADTGSSLLGAKLGAVFMMEENAGLFLNGGITEGLSEEVSGWDGTAGVKVFW